MNVFGIGIDIIEIDRIEKALKKLDTCNMELEELIREGLKKLSKN